MSEIVHITRHLNDFIDWSVNGEIGIMILNNPPQNYIPAPEFISPAILEKEISSAEIKGIIIQGKGRHFSAGADLGELRKLAKDYFHLQNEMTHGKDLLDYIDQLQIPVISAVSGACFGGGLEIALSTHMIFCTESSLFAFPEINSDLMPGFGGTIRLSRRIGIPESMVMMLSGDIIDAPTALSLKMVDRILPNKEVMDFSLKLIQKMVSGKSIKVINHIVKSLKNSQTLSFQQAMKEETKLFCDLAVDKILRNKNFQGE